MLYNTWSESGPKNGSLDKKDNTGVNTRVNTGDNT